MAFSNRRNQVVFAVAVLAGVFKAISSHAAVHGLLDSYGEVYSSACPQMSLVVNGTQNREASLSREEVLKDCQEKMEAAASVIQHELKGKILNVYSCSEYFTGLFRGTVVFLVGNGKR